MGIQINGNTDNISATDGGLTVSDLELNQTGVSTFHSHLHVADQIIHLDDANSKIRFPSNDTISFETNGSERLRIDSDGHLLVSTTKVSSQNGSIQAAGPILCKSFINSHTSNATVIEYNSNISRIRAYGATSGSGILAFSTGGGGNSTDSEALRITSAGVIETKARSAEVRRMILSGSPTNSSFNIEAHDGETGESSGDVQGKLGLFYNDGTTLTNTSCISFIRGSGAPDGAMAFVTNQNERLRIDSSGRVLIGTTTEGFAEADDLTINSADHGGVTIRTPTNKEGNIAFSDTTSGTGEYSGLIRYRHSQNDLGLWTNSNLRLLIDSSGHLLVNTTSVGGGSYDQLTVAGGIKITDDSNSKLEIGRYSSGAPNSYIKIGSNSGSLRVTNAADSSDLFTFTNSGHLLIGTTTEGYGDADDLTIATAGNTGMTIRAGASNYGSIFFSDGTSGGDEYDGFLQYSHGNQRLSIGTGSATKLNVFSNGHVNTQGNNTGNPVGLELRNNNTAAYSHAELTLTSQNTTTSKIWCDVPNARMRFQYNGGTTVGIDQSGNVQLANGSGISFSASGNFGTMNSEILDDYEEGYWTPTIGGHVSDGSSTYGNQKGSYVRIGGIVILNWYISWTSTSASGQFRIYGMPYNSSSTYGTNYNITTGSMMFDSINTPYQYGQMVPYLAHATNQIVFYSSYHTGGWSILNHDSYTSDGGAMIASISYRAA